MAKVENVEITGEGRQILELLMNKHRLTKEEVLQQYADRLGIYDTTINQYLKNKVINNEKFKAMIEADFEKDYEEVVEPAKKQIIYYIGTMSKEIHKYNEEKDLMNSNELIQLCEQHNLSYHRLIAMGNRARIKGNMRLNFEAKPLFEEVIKQAQDLGYMDLFIYYTTNLAYIYNNEENYSASRKRLKELEAIVQEVDDPNKWVVHKYWYIYGITLKNMGMYPAAAGKFKMAYEQAENLCDQVKALINVALSYKSDKKYSLALEWNQKALEACGDHSIMKTTVLNNFAIYHYDTGNIKEAKKYINKAMEIMPEGMDISRKVNILDSYLLIEDQWQNVVEGLVDILLETRKASENRKYLYRCLDNLIEKLTYNDDLCLLIRLRDQLKLLIKVEHNREDTLQLKARFADIMIYLMEKGGVTTC